MVNLLLSSLVLGLALAMEVLLLVLISYGVMMSILITASDLMQDFKTGYLTLTSPRSMFVSQVCGSAIGCILSPLVFWFFFKAYDVGDPEESYPAPYGLMYRGIALLSVEGVSSLSKNCLTPVFCFFIGAVVINIIWDVLQKFETKYRFYHLVQVQCVWQLHSTSVPILLSTCVGSLILYIW
uniref:Uncharacterized protein n=1 Tax=Cucumis sativus TaxID=3659 RepID=A0A0A0LFD0_CUCSA